MFILPFGLFWYFVVKRFAEGNGDLIQSSLIAMLLATGHDVELVTYLFSKPSELSSFLVLALYFTPLFALLAGNDMYASDLGQGFFRFLITRCQRLELFLARFLSIFLLASVLTCLAGLALALSLSANGEYSFAEIYPYLFWILLTLIVYMASFLAYMAIISCLMSSAIATLLVAMVSYTCLLIGISIANAYVNDSGIFSYLLPSGLKTDLIAVDTHDLTLALACLPAYCLIFGILAWLRFKSRNF